jgi:hypothetical protein
MFPILVLQFANVKRDATYVPEVHVIRANREIGWKITVGGTVITAAT